MQDVTFTLNGVFIDSVMIAERSIGLESVDSRAQVGLLQCAYVHPLSGVIFRKPLLNKALTRYPFGLQRLKRKFQSVGLHLVRKSESQSSSNIFKTKLIKE
jgi:hypothetical protein